MAIEQVIGTMVPLAELAESWALKLRSENKSPATMKAYLMGVESFLAWHARQGSAEPALDKPTVYAYLADLREQGQSAATMRLRYAALRLFTRWLADPDVGELETDPLLGMRPPKADRPAVSSLSDEELAALVRACKGRDFTARRDTAIVRLAAQTGLRAGELTGLTVADVDLKAGVVTVRRGKGGKGRVVGIGPVVAQALDAYLRARRSHPKAYTKALWLGANSGGLAYPGMAKAIGVRAEAAGIEGFHLHKLRHGAASRWLAAGGSEDGLMAQMGWTDRNMINVYTHDTAQQRAIKEAARLGLDRI